MTFHAAKGLEFDHVLVLDDGTIAGRRGSLNVDDEGQASQRNVLIEDGILTGYLQDSLNATVSSLVVNMDYSVLTVTV